MNKSIGEQLDAKLENLVEGQGDFHLWFMTEFLPKLEERFKALEQDTPGESFGEPPTQ